MKIVEFLPSKGSYAPGELVCLTTVLDAERSVDGTLRVWVRHLAGKPQLLERSLFLSAGRQTVVLTWMPPATPAGYSAWAELYIGGGEVAVHASTAFDVLEHWTQFPRYGFVSDFSAARPEPQATLDALLPFHINGLQFYDWQRRHDQLLPPADEYIDPLGRPLSLRSVGQLVDEAHRHGMAALPYLAVYAASASFWREHPGWALHDAEGSAIPFGEDFLGLMDPSAGGPWSAHLLSECERALKAIPFDGLHIDQYGEPHQAWDASGRPVDLPRTFQDFISAAHTAHPGKSLLFNAVGNWPVEALAAAPLDCMYIEIWPPDVAYRDVARVVREAVRLSGGKAVVIALYLPADRPANILLADAVILASGGTRIELGEAARLLADPYFPNHQEVSSELRESLQRFYDYAVRNGEWLRPYGLTETDRSLWAESETNPAHIHTAGDIYLVARRHKDAQVLSIVNMQGLARDLHWDEVHAPPHAVTGLNISMHTERCPRAVWWDCPEQPHGASAVEFEFEDGELRFALPRLTYTGMITIHD